MSWLITDQEWESVADYQTPSAVGLSDRGVKHYIELGKQIQSDDLRAIDTWLLERETNPLALPSINFADVYRLRPDLEPVFVSFRDRKPIVNASVILALYA